MKSIRSCDIPSTSTVSIDANFNEGSCTYEVHDKSGQVIWSGFIQHASQTGAMDHTVNTFNPDLMIVRQLAALGNNIELSFAQEYERRNSDGLMVLCDAVEIKTPSLSTSPLVESSPSSPPLL